jgi:hypothetical protein
MLQPRHAAQRCDEVARAGRVRAGGEGGEQRCGARVCCDGGARLA